MTKDVSPSACVSIASLFDSSNTASWPVWMGSAESRRPSSIASLHPLEPAGGELALPARRVFVGERSGQQNRQGGDPGMRVNAEERLVCRLDDSVIEKHEGLDDLPEIRRADEAHDGTVQTT